MFSSALAIAVSVGMTVGADPSKDKPVEFAPVALGMKVPVLTEKDEFDKHLGKVVAIRGKLRVGKISAIAGVDVQVDEKEVNDGDECYAVGILTKWVVKKEDITAFSPANRGPGTFYILYADLVGKLAEAKPIPKK